MYERKLRNTTGRERAIVGERETFIEAVCGLSTILFFVVNVSHGRRLHDDAKYLIASARFSHRVENRRGRTHRE